MASSRKWIRWAAPVLVVAPVVIVVVAAGNQGGTAGPRGAQAVPTTTMTVSQWDVAASNDTFAEVSAHPADHYGDYITWKCNLANIFGQDTPDGMYNVGCWEYTGTYQNDTGDGEIILSIPSSVDTGSLHVGDRLIVRGTVGHPYVHIATRAAYPGPTINVVLLTDQGHDSNAT